MQRHPQDEQHHQHGADAVDDRAVLNGGKFLVGHRHRAGQPDARVIFTGEIEFGGGLPDRVGGLLAGLERVEVEDRLELDEGALVGVSQRLVADEFAPGKGRGSRLQHVLDRPGDQVERALGAVELDLPALDTGKSGFQRAGQPANRGIAGHDFDQGCRGSKLAGHFADLGLGKVQQPVLFKEFTGAERLHRGKMLGVAGQLLQQRRRCRTGQFRRRRIHHRQDGAVAVERLIELIIALAPIQLGRDQRIDVGVDLEILRGVVARCYRKGEGDKDNRDGKPRTSFNDRNDNTCQHIYSFYVGLAGCSCRVCRKRPLSSGVPPIDLMMFWVFSVRARADHLKFCLNRAQGRV